MTSNIATVISFISFISMELIAYIIPVLSVRLVSRHYWFLCCKCLYFFARLPIQKNHWQQFSMNVYQLGG